MQSSGSAQQQSPQSALIKSGVSEERIVAFNEKTADRVPSSDRDNAATEANRKQPLNGSSEQAMFVSYSSTSSTVTSDLTSSTPSLSDGDGDEELEDGLQNSSAAPDDQSSISTATYSTQVT